MNRGQILALGQLLKKQYPGDAFPDPIADVELRTWICASLPWFGAISGEVKFDDLRAIWNGTYVGVSAPPAVRQPRTATYQRRSSGGVTPYVWLVILLFVLGAALVAVLGTDPSLYESKVKSNPVVQTLAADGPVAVSPSLTPKVEPPKIPTPTVWLQPTVDTDAVWRDLAQKQIDIVGWVGGSNCNRNEKITSYALSLALAYEGYRAQGKGEDEASRLAQEVNLRVMAADKCLGKNVAKPGSGDTFAPPTVSVGVLPPLVVTAPTRVATAVPTNVPMVRPNPTSTPVPVAVSVVPVSPPDDTGCEFAVSVMGNCVFGYRQGYIHPDVLRVFESYTSRYPKSSFYGRERSLASEVFEAEGRNVEAAMKKATVLINADMLKLPPPTPAPTVLPKPVSGMPTIQINPVPVAVVQPPPGVTPVVIARMPGEPWTKSGLNGFELCWEGGAISVTDMEDRAIWQSQSSSGCKKSSELYENTDPTRLWVNLGGKKYPFTKLAVR